MNLAPGLSVGIRGARLLFTVLACSVVASVQAQTVSASRAAVRGIVSNQATQQVLEGAKVTSSDGLETYSGPDGSYILTGVPVGQAVVTVSYPGLDKVTEGVTVGAEGTVHDFKLTAGIYKLDTLVVSSSREGNAAAIARQQMALTTGNSISMDAYGNVAKGDMGTFLQRLPGVVGEYGGSAVDAVLVRGLSQEFTTVTTDGVRAASANPDSRSQLVSSLPSDSIESVEVIKTPTADMDGDSLGGVINLRTRSAFDRTGRSIVLNFSEAYNDTFGKNINPSDPSGSKYLFPQVSVQYSDVFQLSGGRKLGVVLTGTYQEVQEAPSTVRAQFNGNWNYTDYTSAAVARRVIYADQEFHVNKRAGLNSKFDLKLSADSSLSFSASFNRFNNFMEQNRPQYQDSVTLDTANSTADYWAFSRVRYRTQRDFRQLDYHTWRFLLEGKHKLGQFDLTWNASFEDSTREQNRLGATVRSNNNFSMTYDRTKDVEFPTLAFTGGITPPDDPWTTNMNSLNSTGTHEDSGNSIASARLDLTRDFNDWRFPVKFKTGLRVREEKRDRDGNYINGSSSAGNYSAYRVFDFKAGWGAGRYPATPIVNTRKYFSDMGVSYQNGQWVYGSAFPYTAADSITESLQNDYKTKETIPAVYSQAEVTLRKDLKATLGVRYEQTKTELTSRFFDATAATPALQYANFQTTKGDYGTWFPNLQFRYEPIKHLIFRAAYSTTIGRPRLADMVGRFSVNDLNDTISFSNPSLKPQYSQNFDLSAEYYFEPVGVVSVGVFRKNLRDFVSTVSFPVVGNEFGLDLKNYVGWTGTSKLNSGKGTVEGFEINYAQQFTFLPGFLKNFGTMANWTALSSEGDYNGLITTRLPFKNNLIGMRPKSGNAGLTFVNNRVDLRLMLNYASDYLVSLNTGDPSSSEFLGARAQWDFFGRLYLTRNVNLFVDAINLTEENRARYQGLPVAARQAQTNIFSRSFTFGIQARF